jgi:hypothetical protein
MTDTPKWRLETREDIDGGTYKAWTDEPTPAHQRATEALSALTERANMAGVRLTYTAIVNAVLPAWLDVDEMAAAYGDAHFGPGGWDDAPAVIRNDIRDDMQRMRRAILGET